MNKYKKKYRLALPLDPPHRWLPPRAFISRMLFLQWVAPSRAIPSQGLVADLHRFAFADQVHVCKGHMFAGGGKG